MDDGRQSPCRCACCHTSPPQGTGGRSPRRTRITADVFANAIKHDFKSKNPTTRWPDVIKLK